MSLLNLAVAVALAEEAGRARARSGVARGEGEECKTLAERTRSPGRELLRLRGRGVLRELVLVGSGPGYGVVVEADGRTVVDAWFSDLERLSRYSSTFTAVTDAGRYIASIQGIRFARGIRVVIRGSVEEAEYVVDACEPSRHSLPGGEAGEEPRDS